MTDGVDSNEKLLERLLLEVRAALPELDARPATAAQLRRRVGNLLGVAAPMSAGAERRPVTILVAELRGFDALVEQFPPARVAELLRLLLNSLQPVIERHEGVIYQLNGAVLTIAFGAQKPQADHAARALACAVEMQQTIARCERHSAGLNLPPVFMGIGVNSGEVLLGAAGITGYRGYTLLGHVPGLAARIAAQSLRGQVLIGESCYRLMNDLILVGEGTSLRVRTRHMPVTVYELLGTSRPRPLAVPRRESRGSPRVLVQMPCYFERLASDAAPRRESEAELLCGQVVDFGYRGLRMISPVALPASGEIKMSLSLQLLGRNSSDVYARVVSSVAEQHGYRCGVEFTDVDLPARQVIRQFVDSQLGAV
jgi:adenylate cyclase